MGTPNLFSYVTMMLFVALARAAAATMSPAQVAVLSVFFTIGNGQILYIGVPAGALIFSATSRSGRRPGRLVNASSRSPLSPLTGLPRLADPLRPTRGTGS